MAFVNQIHWSSVIPSSQLWPLAWLVSPMTSSWIPDILQDMSFTHSCSPGIHLKFYASGFPFYPNFLVVSDISPLHGLDVLKTLLFCFYFLSSYGRGCFMLSLFSSVLNVMEFCLSVSLSLFFSMAERTNNLGHGLQTLRIALSTGKSNEIIRKSLNIN